MTTTPSTRTVPLPASHCTVCGGALVPSQYEGMIHDDDADDTHTPSVAPRRPVERADLLASFGEEEQS